MTLHDADVFDHQFVSPSWPPNAGPLVRERALEAQRMRVTIERDRAYEVCGSTPDVWRFRPNILIASMRSMPFEEDAWVEGVLRFGATTTCATIGVINRDERCSMVNLDPDSARSNAEVLKAIVRARNNKAGRRCYSMRPHRSRAAGLLRTVGRETQAPVSRPGAFAYMGKRA
jgi:hypothetical protein